MFFWFITKLLKDTTTDTGDEVYITHRWSIRINPEVPSPDGLSLSLPSGPQPLASPFEGFA
jgi:hypothetical protein